MAPPSYHKEDVGTPDGLSERTYHNDNTYYNIELNKLRSQIPDAQATRPRSMEDGYNPRYDSINNAPPTGSSRALKRVEKVYATMCCGSCCGVFAWVIGSLIIIAAFIVLIVKVFHPSVDGAATLSSTSAALLGEKTTTVTQSPVSVPVSTTTTSYISTDTTTITSVSVLTSITVTTETYTPPSPTTFTVTSEGEETTILATVTSLITTSAPQIPTSTVTEIQTDEDTVTETETETTVNLTTATTSVLTTEEVTTTQRSQHDNDDKNDNDDDDESSIPSTTRYNWTGSGYLGVSTILVTSYTTTTAAAPRWPIDRNPNQVPALTTRIEYPFEKNWAYVYSQRVSLNGFIKSQITNPSMLSFGLTKAAYYESVLSRVNDWCAVSQTSGAAEDIFSYCNTLGTPNKRDIAVTSGTASDTQPKHMVAITTTMEAHISLLPTPQPQNAAHLNIVVAATLADERAEKSRMPLSASSTTSLSVSASSSPTRPSSDLTLKPIPNLSNTDMFFSPPYSHNLAYYKLQLHNVQTDILAHTTDTSYKAKFVGTLPSYSSILGSISTYCRSATIGAHTLMVSYCFSGASPMRREAVPPVTTTIVADEPESTGTPSIAEELTKPPNPSPTTLITKTILTTNLLPHLSLTSNASTSPSLSPKARSVLNKWGKSDTSHPLLHGTSFIRLGGVHWDCVKSTYTCTVFLSWIGVLCGIPLGALLWVIFKWYLRRRAAKKQEKEEKGKETAKLVEKGRRMKDKAARERMDRGVRSAWAGMKKAKTAGGGGETEAG